MKIAGQEPANQPDGQEELGQLLEELRVMLPGTEVLFAFLLTVPFSNRFNEITVEQRYTYFVAFISAALATVFLIAPSSLHRVQRHPRNMERMLRTATLLAIIGSAFMAGAMTAVVFLVTELLFNLWFGSLCASVIAGLAIWLWFGLPLLRRVGH